MRCVAFAVVAALAATPLFGDLKIRPISGVGCLNYDVETGKVTPADPSTRYGAPIWSCGWEYVDYFWGAEPDAGEMGLDWGDVAGPATVGGLGFAEFTNSQAADGDLYAIIAIYAEENGWGSSGRALVAGYRIENIPGSEHPVSEYWGHIWGIDLGAPFVLNGSDLDGDSLTDWGYAQFFSGRTPGCAHGPPFCGQLDPNHLPPEAPGVEDAFDLFVNSGWNSDPNGWLDDDPNLQNGFIGTYWFGCCLFAQFYFELYAPQCPNRGDSGRYCHADIDGSYDCIVSLADLAQLLSNYGMTSGAGLLDGDVDPYDPYSPGDGDVDLGDLTELLSQYGDDCNWP
jgi:hypothetical protein